jgi:hypothetical protein
VTVESDNANLGPLSGPEEFAHKGHYGVSDRETEVRRGICSERSAHHAGVHLDTCPDAHRKAEAAGWDPQAQACPRCGVPAGEQCLDERGAGAGMHRIMRPHRERR